MKTSTLLGLFLALALSTYADQPLAPKTAASLYTHLFEVNTYWQDHKADCPSEIRSFETDVERIQCHLRLVVSSLRATGNTHPKRLALLDSLAQYAERGVFPINLYHPGRRPYFIDHLGTHCAVGYLMKASGHGDLAEQISREQNYAYLRDIHNPSVQEWADAHGFVLEELMWVQPEYLPTTVFTPIENRPNGPIDQLVPYHRNYLLVSGEFDSLGTTPCSQIGRFSSNQLDCLGTGLDGLLEGIGMEVDTIIAMGSFISNGDTFPIAKFNGQNWEYSPGPEGDSTYHQRHENR